MSETGPLISTHIEKTGGTTVESAWLRNFADVLLWVPTRNGFIETDSKENL